MLDFAPLREAGEPFGPFEDVGDAGEAIDERGVRPVISPLAAGGRHAGTGGDVLTTGPHLHLGQREDGAAIAHVRFDSGEPHMAGGVSAGDGDDIIPGQSGVAARLRRGQHDGRGVHLFAQLDLVAHREAVALRMSEVGRVRGKEPHLVHERRVAEIELHPGRIGPEALTDATAVKTECGAALRAERWTERVVPVNEVDATPVRSCALAAAGDHLFRADAFDAGTQVFFSLQEHDLAEREEVTLLFTKQTRGGDPHFLRQPTARRQHDRQRAGIWKIRLRVLGDDGAAALLALADQLHIEAMRKPIASAHRATIRRRRDEHHGVEHLRLAEIQLHPFGLGVRRPVNAMPAEPGGGLRHRRRRQAGEVRLQLHAVCLDLPHLLAEKANHTFTRIRRSARAQQHHSGREDDRDPAKHRHPGQ